MEDTNLNDKQMMAVELALTGMSDGEIARKIRVSRQWVNTWRNHDAIFIDTLEARRRALREKHQDSLNGLVEKAIAVLKEAMDDEDPKTRLQAAKMVLATAALKDSMKAGKPENEGELILKQLVEAMSRASRELGYREPGGG